jgi:hypothetical protein
MINGHLRTFVSFFACLGSNLEGKSYSYFWVLLRCQKFICRRFGTLCSIFIGDLRKPHMNMKQCVLKLKHIHF